MIHILRDDLPRLVPPPNRNLRQFTLTDPHIHIARTNLLWFSLVRSGLCVHAHGPESGPGVRTCLSVSPAAIIEPLKGVLLSTGGLPHASVPCCSVRASASGDAFYLRPAKSPGAILMLLARVTRTLWEH
jgi:hypothetical protein